MSYGESPAIPEVLNLSTCKLFDIVHQFEVKGFQKIKQLGKKFRISWNLVGNTFGATKDGLLYCLLQEIILKDGVLRKQNKDAGIFSFLIEKK